MPKEVNFNKSNKAEKNIKNEYFDNLADNVD
jgi:hypothetical protein